MLNNKPISGESFFEPMPKRSYGLDPKFVPLDKSIIWHFNYLFWKHFSLWEKTYGEHYEASLPSGISESHREQFIIRSTNKFINLLTSLEKEGSLPKEIVVLEQGPGTGLYAKKFLDYVKEWCNKNNKVFYQRILYVLQDVSSDILHTATNALADHVDHIITHKTLPLELKNQVLFVRHSNLWDQLPCRILKLSENNVSELLVQASLDVSFEKELSLIERSLVIKDSLPYLRKKHVEKIIARYPKMWKPLVRNIKLKTKWKTLSALQENKSTYCKTLKEFGKENKGTYEITFSKGILDNISKLIGLVDWERGGFMEIVDIIVPDISGFHKKRYPKKYDGSIATVVNGPMIKHFLRERGKHVIFEKIRGLNHTVTIRNHSLKGLLDGGHFVTIAEIAVMRNQPIGFAYNQAMSLYAKGIDVIAFSDQAFARKHYLALSEVLSSKMFSRFTGKAIMPIVKVRNKTLGEVDVLISKLKEQKVANIFLVTGDPENRQKPVLNTSFSLLPKFSKNFYTGTVVHPNKDDIPNMLVKIKKGASFFIMQATYDKRQWKDWLEEIKKQGVHRRVAIIAAIIPIVSRRTLSVIEGIKDIPISGEILREFDHLDDLSIRKKGISLAQELLKIYKETQVFSGIYIYSKSEEVVFDVVNK